MGFKRMFPVQLRGWFLLFGCAGFIGLGEACVSRVGISRNLVMPESFHLSDFAKRGDARRQASTRLILSGLNFDQAGKLDQAAAQYELAIRLDPTNPYAYLAFARHYCESSDPLRSLSYLDKLESLQPSHELPKGARVHLVGLRGWALSETGESNIAMKHLAKAKVLSPRVWSDDRLSPEELR